MATDEKGIGSEAQKPGEVCSRCGCPRGGNCTKDADRFLSKKQPEEKPLKEYSAEIQSSLRQNVPKDSW